MPLLADPDFEVAKLYDAHSSRLKMTKRAVIVVGEDGKVLHRHDHALGLDFQTVADLKKTLDSLPRAGLGAQPLLQPTRVGQREVALALVVEVGVHLDPVAPARDSPRPLVQLGG